MHHPAEREKCLVEDVQHGIHDVWHSLQQGII